MSLAALDASLSCYSPQIVLGGRHFGIRRIKSKKERTINEGDSGRDQEGQVHGGTILSMAQ